MIPEKTSTSGPRGATFILPVSTAGRFLVVTCGTVNLAVPAALIQSIIGPSEAGDTNGGGARDYSFRMMDLHSRLGTQPSPQSSDAAVLLCKGAEKPCAFRVDRVEGYMQIETRQIRPLPPHFSGEERRWFSGYILFRDSLALLADPAWLLEWPSLLWAAAEFAHPIGAEVLELELAADGEDVPWADA